MEPKNASRHNTARTSAVCHQIVRKSAIFSNSHCQSTGNRASSAMTAYKPTMTATEATIILRKENRYAQASSTDPRMIAKAKMEAPAAKVPIQPISAISPKTMKTPPHIATSKAQSRPTTNRKRYRPTTCAVRETGISPRMALCPADSSDDAGPNALIHAIADAKPPSPPIRPLATCSSTWVDIIISDTTIDSTGKTSRNTIFATLNRPVPTQSNRHCFTTDFQLIVTIPLKQICERQLHTRFHMPQPSLSIPQ